MWSGGEVTGFLLAHIADLLASGNWQRAGRANAPKPKPIPRPGMKDNKKTIGAGAIPLSSFDDWWG